MSLEQGTKIKVIYRKNERIVFAHAHRDEDNVSFYGEADDEAIAKLIVRLWLNSPLKPDHIGVEEWKNTQEYKAHEIYVLEQADKMRGALNS